MSDPAAEKVVPKLQPPGAGLPWWELFLLRRVVFPRACRRLTWGAAAQLFQDEGRRILAAWDAVPAGRVAEPVLVRRPAGIEDSSRHWSVAMTVEHLTVTGNLFRQIIRSLRRGQVPTNPARVEDVKPGGAVSPAAVREAFTRLLADAASDEAAEPPVPRGAGPRFAHPWLGPLDADRWHCVLGLHQRLHRKQVEAICAGLAGPRPGRGSA